MVGGFVAAHAHPEAETMEKVRAAAHEIGKVRAAAHEKAASRNLSSFQPAAPHLLCAQHLFALIHLVMYNLHCTFRFGALPSQLASNQNMFNISIHARATFPHRGGLCEKGMVANNQWYKQLSKASGPESG